MTRRWLRFVLALAAALGGGAARLAAQPAAPLPSADDVFQAAKDLFDQNAPDEVKQQYEFPDKAQFNEFAARLQAALDGTSLEDLAQLEPEARAALALLEATPAGADYAAWLEAKLPQIEAARQVERVPPPPAGPVPPIPYYEFWVRRIRARAAPPNASSLIPKLRAAFAAEGVPPQLAWLAEAESSLNPLASNPSGARGLFQLKAATAREMGLSTFLPDQRTDPERSARAAAHYLRALERHFGSWPLALAAYNAGEGRVGRALAARHASDYAGIASALPAETRMYVPEVCALVEVRGGLAPDDIPRPRG